MWIKDKLMNKWTKYKAKQLLKIDDSIKLTDYKKACFPHSNIPRADYNATNEVYGHLYHIKHFAGFDKNTIINCAITHGIDILSSSVVFYEIAQPISMILVAGEQQKKNTEKITNLRAITVGPFIAYADDFLSQKQFEDLKKKWGKILLVFPSHSMPGGEFEYDYQEFIDEIKKVSKNFDTILVCMIAYDLAQNKHALYEKNGFIIVSAGDNTNYNFLKRLKSIIKLSDAMIGNEYTTGLSYALYLNKPVYLFKQKTKIVCSGNTASGINNGEQLEMSVAITEELFNICSDSNFGNLKKQREWGEYYFGFNQVKTKNELREILLPLVRK